MLVNGSNQQKHTIMKTIKQFLMLFAIGIALAGCSSLRTASDYDRDVDFSGYKTYNFYDKGLAQLRLNNLDKRRLMSAVEAGMNAKGFVKVDQQPNLLVNLVVVARQRTEMYNPGFYGGWGWGWGMGWRNPFWGAGPGYVNQYMEGTIIIDLLDPAKKILVWHGSGTGFDMTNFRNREERLHAGVAEILAQYPPTTTASK